MNRYTFTYRAGRSHRDRLISGILANSRSIASSHESDNMLLRAQDVARKLK